MHLALVLVASAICVASALETVPYAHGFARKNSDIRRAPVVAQSPEEKAFSAVPHAKGLVRTSTGVRRAPNHNTAPVVVQRAPVQQVIRRPLSPRPLGLMPMAVQPLHLPIISPENMPTLPTIAPMPTLPSLTMPPSFQRLLGITTTPTPSRPKKYYEERNERNERNDRSEEHYRVKSSGHRTSGNRDLTSVGSRLPKFVSDGNEEVVSPEKNADWIVPF